MELEWIKKARKTIDPPSRERFDLPFFRLNIIDFYNYNIGNVDLTDQLRNHYRYDVNWHRNRNGGGPFGVGDFKFYSLILLFFTRNFIHFMTARTLYRTTTTSNRLPLRGLIETWGLMGPQHFLQ